MLTGASTQPAVYYRMLLSQLYCSCFQIKLPHPLSGTTIKCLKYKGLQNYNFFQLIDGICSPIPFFSYYGTIVNPKGIFFPNIYLNIKYALLYYLEFLDLHSSNSLQVGSSWGFVPVLATVHIFQRKNLFFYR